MSHEGLMGPRPESEVLPENSSYSIHWDASSEKFHITRPGSSELLLVLDEDIGYPIYERLLGQQNMEGGEKHKPASFPPGALTKQSFVQDVTRRAWVDENDLQGAWATMRKHNRDIPQGGINPPFTRRHMYQGGKPFVHVENLSKPPYDTTHAERKLNLETDCIQAVDNFAETAEIEWGMTEYTGDFLSTYEELLEAIQDHAPPLRLVMSSESPDQENLHAFVVLGFSADECICFEKVETSKPWRLGSLWEIHQRYVHDFRRIHKNAKISWTIKETIDNGKSSAQ